VLWDIDHTLIKTGGVGREVFAAAFERTTGQPMRDMVSPSGLTEPVIFERTLALHGVTDSDDLFPIFAEYQAAEYRLRAEDMRNRGRVLPGAEQALQAFGKHPNVVSSVLTGNPRLSAVAKLQIFGLADYLDLPSGVYGDDASERAELVPISWDRAGREHGQVFDAGNTLIIGDTPNDVAAAHANGVLAVAVASGSFSMDDLREAGPDLTISDLLELDPAPLLEHVASRDRQ
jgi:phosphoglycolate phosphatase-like HAD superfamily hydrolase